MDKPVLYNDYRVIVLTQEDSLLDAERTLAQIRRHVDIDRAYITCRTICKFCGYNWEEPPQCCEEAMKFEDSKTRSTTAELQRSPLEK